MEVLKRGKTPEGYNLAIYEWDEYADNPNLATYTVTAFTPSKGHDSQYGCAPKMGDTWAWMFEAKSIEQAESMLSQMEHGTPPSEFKDRYMGDPKYRDFI